jgi:septal ring factor EnvC (AmiA/AmiB activator)
MLPFLARLAGQATQTTTQEATVFSAQWLHLFGNIVLQQVENRLPIGGARAANHIRGATAKLYSFLAQVSPVLLPPETELRESTLTSHLITAQTQRNTIQNQLDSLTARLAAINQQQENYNAQISALSQETNTIQTKLTELSTEIARLQSQLPADANHQEHVLLPKLSSQHPLTQPARTGLLAAIKTTETIYSGASKIPIAGWFMRTAGHVGAHTVNLANAIVGTPSLSQIKSYPIKEEIDFLTKQQAELTIQLQEKTQKLSQIQSANESLAQAKSTLDAELKGKKIELTKAQQTVEKAALELAKVSA